VKTSRQEIFKQAARKLRQDFAELSSVPHSGLKGGEAERLIRDFLRAHLPRRFGVGSGFILDAKDNVSPQTDVIIYDAFNCPVYRASEEAGIYPCQNVVGVIEVKSVLDKQKLLDACKKIQAVKQLQKILAPEHLGKTSQTFGFIFAFGSSIGLETIAQHYTDFLKADAFRIGTHIDSVAILDIGSVNMMVRPRGFQWGRYMHETAGRPEISEGFAFALGMDALAEDSLDSFLREVLARVALFWSVVDHPGFDWSTSNPDHRTKLQFLATICHETNPNKRSQLEKQYEAEIREEFAHMNKEVGRDDSFDI
jgi:hypothetical protein